MGNDKISSEEAEANVRKLFGEGTVLGAAERKMLRLQSLIEVAKAINSKLEKNALLQSILYSCQGQVAIFNASIFINSILEEHVFCLECSIGLDQEIEFSIKEKDPLIKLLKTKISHIHVQDYIKNRKMKVLKKIHEELKGELVFPLKMKDKLNGILVLGKKLDDEPFDFEDIQHITSFAELASVSIENMILFEVATLDRMTKLYNHYYFQSRLQEEVQRAIRYNHPLALILCDLDHFKNVNDEYGHQMGDQVIISFSKYLKEKVRDVDIVARYGGEEFAIILPETTIEDAKIVANKIRIGFPRKKIAPGLKRKVTASFGIACYEKGKIETSYELIHYADQALYLSKKKGRNKVYLYTNLD